VNGAPIRSLGYRTDLFLASLDGEVIDRGAYLVIRTPTNPDFWWGNYLLYREPPPSGAVARCLAEHARELPAAPTVLLAWDAPDERGPVDAFAAAGLEIDESVILTADAVRPPPRVAREARLAPLDGTGDWEAAAEALTAAFADKRAGSIDDLRRFIERQLARYQAIQARGEGRWFGARIDGQMAGCLGVVKIGELGRFQLVGTDPRFGRRGVCGSLVHHAARFAFDTFGCRTLVMAADATYHAARVYESVGFAPTERLFAAIRKPPAT
jgi:RimJ/RimL family protein N-acetyltransferase